MKIPLNGGREFAAGDIVSAPAVAIVNETLARRLWPGANPMGRMIRGYDGLVQVVGVARDAKYTSFADSSEPYLYLPRAQTGANNVALSLAVRITGDAALVRRGIEREVKALVPAWPAFDFRSMEEGAELQRLAPRIGATVLGVLGVFAMLLASVGLYGVMAYVVRQRTHEIGIRLAVGAPVSSVIALVVRQGMAVCAAGAVLGIGLSLGVAQVITSVLSGISGFDPLTYAAVPSMLALVAALACYMPSRRLTGLDPLRALHDE